MTVPDLPRVRRVLANGGHGFWRVFHEKSLMAGDRARVIFGDRWGVAELAKRRTVNPEIGGSNPPAPVSDAKPPRTELRAGRFALRPYL